MGKRRGRGVWKRLLKAYNDKMMSNDNFQHKKNEN
jgi:hypothetical protein